MAVMTSHRGSIERAQGVPAFGCPDLLSLRAARVIPLPAAAHPLATRSPVFSDAMLTLLRTPFNRSRGCIPLAPGLTSRAVLDTLAAVQIPDVHFLTTNGRTLILSRDTELDAGQKLLVKRLNLDLPPHITAPGTSTRPTPPM